jgi:hypothetical protein
MGEAADRREPTREEWAFVSSVHNELRGLLDAQGDPLAAGRSTGELLHIVRNVVMEHLIKARRDSGTPLEQSFVVPRTVKQETWEAVRAPLEALISEADKAELDEHSIAHAGAGFWGGRLAMAYTIIELELKR